MNGADDIVRRLEAEANEVAREYLERLEAFQEAEEMGRMETLIEDISDAIDERGDAKKLHALGVTVKESYDGTLWFIKGNKKLAVRPRENMTIKVGHATVYPNRDCPIFDDRIYEDVLERVFAWAKK